MVDPFLNVWDERFHALVAKNLMNHPLKPTLYDDPIVNMAYDVWDRYHIWLHKQPLFLWQIALSFKLFGVNEFTLRLPNVILCCVTVFAIYRSGKILCNHNVGYYAALLFITSHYLFSLLSGLQATDHNDTSFLAYITLSLWAWIEYVHTKKIFWIILIGVFSGFAILCKWLAGLLVYLGWGIYSFQKNKWNISKYGNIILALIITAIIVLPWQLLILNWYPTEAKAAYEYYSGKHFFEVVDGHEGPWYFHFAIMNELFGIVTPFLLIPALIIFYKKTDYKNICIGMIAIILFVYALFSIAQTKMSSFTFILALPIYVSLGFAFDYLENLTNKMKILSSINKFILFVLISFLAIARIDIKTLDEMHGIIGKRMECFPNLIHNKKIFQSLHLPSNTVIFNATGDHYIEAMFYTGLTAYNFIPTNEQYLDMKRKNKIIALFPKKNDTVPLYLQEDNTIIFIRDTLKKCE